jgi:arginine deiminase
VGADRAARVVPEADGTMPVHVSSEIGRLHAVLVHTPGPELLAVTPTTKEDYLYDDIIDLETARREHRRFAAILERFATVYQVRDLLADALGNAGARELLVREAMEVVHSEPLAREITEMPADELAGRLIEGVSEPAVR